MECEREGRKRSRFRRGEGNGDGTFAGMGACNGKLDRREPGIPQDGERRTRSGEGDDESEERGGTVGNEVFVGRFGGGQAGGKMVVEGRNVEGICADRDRDEVERGGR